MSSTPFQYFAPAQPEVELHEFQRAARLLHERSGIVLGDHKREMVSRTLHARVDKANMESVDEYLTFLQRNPQSPEWDGYVNAFTINHTAFFREKHHFQILSEFVQKRSGPVSVWCCAASTGEEPYTIAMTLKEALPAGSHNFGGIWATDIDTAAIETAKEGTYTAERVGPVPEEYLKKYFLRGKNRQSGRVKIKPEIRNMVEFEPFNLLSPTWPTGRKFDAIFCRNVMIYFDRETQARVLERFGPMLKPGGLLFAGHSENFSQLTKAFRLRGLTVYTKVG